MSDKQQYITQEGERWDTIAWKAYASIERIPDIIAANPTIPIMDRLAGGIVINIPIVETADAKISKELLPPWKQEL